MKAVITTGFEESAVEEVPVPSPDEHEVLIAVERVQLSITDCQLYRGQEVVHHESVKERIEDGGARAFGHEFCGEVVETGENVNGFSIGDRVYAAGKIPCRSCAYCEVGYEQYCKNNETIGLEGPGALAEYVALDAGPLRKIPDAVTNAEGAALQPLASAVLCVQQAAIDEGDVVAVLGTGVMGYQCGQLALLNGAREVVAVDVVQEKLDLAAEKGMTPVNVRDADLEEEITRITNGIGADIVFEAIGGDQDNGSEGTDPLAQAYSTVRSGGKIVQVGSIGGEITLTPRLYRSKHINWINPLRGVKSLGPNADSGDLASSLVAEDRVTIEEYITHELDGLASFEESVEINLNKDEYGALGPSQIRI